MISWLPPLLAAPFAGSTVGVLITRLPGGRKVAFARSACDSCGRRLVPIDLVPIASFVAWRGRCRFCKRPIAPFHLLVEVAAFAVAALVVSLDDDAGRIWADCGLGWTLLALAWIDVRHLMLPDVLTLPLITAGLVVTWVLAPDNIVQYALGAIAGYLAFQTIEWLYQRLRGRQGLGEGDAKLLAAGGAWTGIAALPTIVLGAALIGIVMVLLLRKAKCARSIDVAPFGPALALAILLVRLVPEASGNGPFSIIMG